MASNGILKFQGTNKATFVGATSNVVIDTVKSSLGIGVDVDGPTSNLHVVGNAYVSTELTVTGNVAVDTDTLFVDTVNNRVGIGTTTPTELLDITAASGDYDAFIRLRSGSGGTSPVTESGLKLTESGEYGFQFAHGAATDLLKIRHQNAAGVVDLDDIMVWNPNGNVGIGTSSPQSPFHVNPINGTTDSENAFLDFRRDFSPHGHLGIFATETHTNAIGPDLRFKGSIYNGTSNPTIRQVMCLKPTGNVGIGTTSPDAKLNIQGTSEGAPPTSGGEGTSNGIFRLRDNFNVALDIGTLGASPWSTWLQVADTTTMGVEYPLSLNPNGGNVGIGTTSPGVKFQVGSNAETTPQYIRIRGNRVNEAGDICGIQMYNSANSGDRGNSAIINSRGVNNYGSTLRFWTNPDSNTPALERMCINSVGNVGIGTTSPATNLHVFHPTYGVHRSIYWSENPQNPATQNPIRMGYLGSSDPSHASGGIGLFKNTFEGSSEDEAVRIQANGISWFKGGNVGIGTTSPSYKLHVSAGDDSISYYGPNTTWSSYLAVGSGDDKTIANDTTIAQCITTNGNLHLDGAHSRAVYLNHYSGTTVYYQSTVIHGSDDRLKSDEELITNATETLLKLSPQKYKKAYTLREDESREPFVESGLMAQDVWYDAPELRHLVHLGADASPVDTKPEAPVDGDIQQDPDYSSWGTETAALNYDGLIAYLIKSNQELHARIQALENA